MDVYSDGSAVSAVIEFKNSNTGIDITPVSVTYKVYDESKAEIIASTSYTFGADDTEAAITVPGSSNTLGVEDDRILRVIVLKMTTADGSIYSNTYTYVIEHTDVLDVMWNSYQTYEQAQLSAMNIASLPGWDAATEIDRKSALAEAFHMLGKLTYKATLDLNSNDAAEFLAFDEDFVSSVRLAQVAEADHLLGGSPSDTLRSEGLMAKSVGESSQMFRAGKPISLPVCAKALRLLTGYISFGMALGRS